jgi:hypothetical protein
VERALLVDPADRSVVQFETGLAPRTLRRDEPIHLGAAVPGFRLTVDALFGSLRLDQ